MIQELCFIKLQKQNKEEQQLGGNVLISQVRKHL